MFVHIITYPVPCRWELRGRRFVHMFVLPLTSLYAYSLILLKLSLMMQHSLQSRDSLLKISWCIMGDSHFAELPPKLFCPLVSSLMGVISNLRHSILLYHSYLFSIEGFLVNKTWHTYAALCQIYKFFESNWLGNSQLNV